MRLPDWMEFAGSACKRLRWLVAILAMAASYPAVADVVLEHEAHGGLVSLEIIDCVATERRRYADFDAAKVSNYVGGHAIELREVSVWIRRPTG